MARLSDEQKTFAIWLSLPKDMRKPKTQHLLAKDLDVEPMTLSRWKKLPALQAEIERTHVTYLKDRLGELYRALVDHAIGGRHPKYMEMALLIVRDQFGKKEVNVHVTNETAAQMTTETAAGRLFELMNKTNPDRLKDTGLTEEAFVEAVATQQPALN